MSGFLGRDSNLLRADFGGGDDDGKLKGILSGLDFKMPFLSRMGEMMVRSAKEENFKQVS